MNREANRRRISLRRGEQWMVLSIWTGLGAVHNDFPPNDLCVLMK